MLCIIIDISGSSSNNTSPHKLLVYDRGQGCDNFILIPQQRSAVLFSSGLQPVLIASVTSFAMFRTADLDALA